MIATVGTDISIKAVPMFQKSISVLLTKLVGYAQKEKKMAGGSNAPIVTRHPFASFLMGMYRGDWVDNH